MEFELGERVKVKATGREGEIREFKHELYLYNGVRTETKRYRVYLGFYQTEWHTADKLESLSRYSFDDNFEKGLLDLMTDVNLGERNFEQVKKLQEEKKKFKK